MMKKLLLLLVLIIFFSGCSARNHYLHMASESMTVGNQVYYLKKVQEIDRARARGTSAEESCGTRFFPAEYGGFTTHCT